MKEFEECLERIIQAAVLVNSAVEGKKHLRTAKLALDDHLLHA